jgi:hypothetical protein
VLQALGARFRCRPTEELPHHREIVLEWDDGSACTIRPDQGVTFVQTRRRERFNFGAPEDRQAEAVRGLSASLVKRDAAPVLVYVSTP